MDLPGTDIVIRTISQIKLPSLSSTKNIERLLKINPEQARESQKRIFR